MDKKRVDITMANPYLAGMELLIKDGLYQSQTEIIKDALRRLFRHYEIMMVNGEADLKLAVEDLAV